MEEGARRKNSGEGDEDAHPLALELDVPESDTGVTSERPVEREAVREKRKWIGVHNERVRENVELTLPMRQIGLPHRRQSAARRERWAWERRGHHMEALRKRRNG
jgi:hypothetical protein